MSNNILKFPEKLRPALFTKDHEPSAILNRAYGADLQAVLVIGYDEHGNPWFDTSTLDMGELVTLYFMARNRIEALS